MRMLEPRMRRLQTYIYTYIYIYIHEYIYIYTLTTRIYTLEGAYARPISTENCMQFLMSHMKQSTPHMRQSIPGINIQGRKVSIGPEERAYSACLCHNSVYKIINGTVDGKMSTPPQTLQLLLILTGLQNVTIVICQSLMPASD